MTADRTETLLGAGAAPQVALSASTMMTDGEPTETRTLS